MRILFLNHNHERFGTYFRCYFLAQGLSNLGHRVTMICASGKKFDLLIRKKKINPNFTIITLPRIKYHRYFTGQAFLRLPLTILHVLFSKFDLLYAFTVAQPQIGVPALIAKKVKKKPLLIDWDDFWGGGFAKAHGGVIQYILTWFERNVVKFADQVTYVSDFLGKEIEKIDALIPKKKIVNGANEQEIRVIDKNTAKRRLEFDLAGKFLLSVGNTYTDSFGLMLKAFQKAREKLKDLKLILVGNLEIKEDFKPLFRQLKDNILVIGPKPYSEISYYLAAADTLILPMDDDQIEYARFPMRFGDYLCAKRPIVSNAVGEVKKYLKKYKAGFVTPTKNYQKMAEAIIESFLNQKLSSEFSENARKLAEGSLSRRRVVKQVSKSISSLKRNFCTNTGKTSEK